MCKNIQTIGSINKEDKLKVLDFSILDNTLVLETYNPFPGYHSEIIEKGKPKTIYYVIKHSMEREEIARLYKELAGKLDFYFHFTISKVILNNQSFHAIRANKFENYNQVLELQKALAENFIPFSNGKVKEGNGIIKTSKLFNLDQVEEGLFICKKNPYFSYFIVPKKVSWDDFKEITLKVRHSWDLVNFDAAQAVFYVNNYIQDVVRIYSKDSSKEDLIEIREKYLSKIK